ncbi:heterodisulfide reductase subunit C [Methanococcus voltae]|uniref:CoB--CoM heterodisulfide reductase subunit C n=1 Tax=Methanococcus voltae TaxID=2188 RepID=UPI001AE2DBE9|nr:CoB--CoM heterodisulfide reductase subunit C [Methanococcus voltae]MBP2144097.1 heterodisulfide reductase subunit C [Methanococcus voltae]
MVLKSNEYNKEFSEAIVNAGIDFLGEDKSNSFKRCYQCGTCTGACPSGRITGFRTRKIIRQALLGDEDLLSSDDLWMCTTCYECYEKCPREVKITDLIKVIRNLASEKGYIAEPHRKTSLYVFKTGHAVPVNAEMKKARLDLGLTEIPPTTHKYPEALQMIKDIMGDLNFCKKVGICEETGELTELDLKYASE